MGVSFSIPGAVRSAASLSPSNLGLRQYSRHHPRPHLHLDHLRQDYFTGFQPCQPPVADESLQFHLFHLPVPYSHFICAPKDHAYPFRPHIFRHGIRLSRRSYCVRDRRRDCRLPAEEVYPENL